MEQLMSGAISYASTGRGFPVARVCAEVCLDPVSAAQRCVCIALEMPFSSAWHLAKRILRASPVSIPTNRRYFLGFLSNS
jgi:hypothetical protein